MSKTKGFQMILKWEKLSSVNKMYMRTKTGITLSPQARKFKKEVAKQVRVQLPKVLPFNNKDVFKLSLQFVLKTRFFIRDTSNFVKLVEDCIFDELDINDARVLELEAKKSFAKGSKYEYVIATVETSDFDYDYFNKTEDESNEEVNLSEKIYSQKDFDNLLTEKILEVLELNLDDLEELKRNKASNEIPDLIKKTLKKDE